MRHGKKIHKLERPREHRLALISNLATALITHGRITTTEAKAKALKPVIDRLIRTAKMNSVQSRRQVGRMIRNRDTLRKLFDEIAPEMLDRTSGYSRIMLLGPRRGDGAKLAVIELVAKDSEEETAREKSGRKKSARQANAKAKAKPAEAKDKPAAAPAAEQEVTEYPEAGVEETPVEEKVDKGEAEAAEEAEVLEATEKAEESSEEPAAEKPEETEKPAEEKPEGEADDKDKKE